MILTTTENINGKETQILGIVKGSTVQTTHMMNDLLQGFKNLVGGELTSYNDMMNDARAMATMRMIREAERMGADAVVCMRYASSSITAGAAEVIAYGTAVKFLN